MVVILVKLHYFTLFLDMFLFLYPTCPAHLQFRPHTLPSLSSPSSNSQISFINEWIKSMPFLSLSLHHKYYTLYFPKVSLYYITLQIFLKNICWIYYYEYKVSVYIHLMKYVILTNKLEILQYLSYD